MTFLEGPTPQNARVRGGKFTYMLAHIQLPDGRKKWTGVHVLAGDTLDWAKQEITRQALLWAERNPR